MKLEFYKYIEENKVPKELEVITNDVLSLTINLASTIIGNNNVLSLDIEVEDNNVPKINEYFSNRGYAHTVEDLALQK